MSTHTQEPWEVSEESFDNDGIQESVIRALGGVAAVAVTLDFGPNNPGMREANARRIVACVNACAGISAEDLEQQDGLAGHVARQAFITNMQAAQGQGFGLALEGGACRILVESFVGQFKGAGAINSLEVGFDHPETGPMIVTMQRAQGKTPAQQRNEAELLRDELLTALEQFLDPAGSPPADTGEWREACLVIAKARKAKGLCYYAPDGTLMSPDGTRSIFDDVDK